METGPLLAGVIILILCLIPIIISRKNRIKKDKQFKQIIFNLAAASNSENDTYERWNNTVIGLNNANRQLFFYRKMGDKDISESIDLSNFQRCSVVATKTNTKDAAYSAIEKVTLGLTSTNKSSAQTTLEFYNNQYDSLTIMDELKLAEKWCELINAVIVKNNSARVTA